MRYYENLNNKSDFIFEIRTTHVENLMVPLNNHQILSFLQDMSFRGIFVLQQLQYSKGVGKNYKEKFQKPEHIFLVNILKPYSKLELLFKIFFRDGILGYALLEATLEMFD